MSFKYLRFSFIAVFMCAYMSAGAQQKVSYAWVDTLLSSRNVVEAKSKLDSIMVLHPEQMDAAYYFKRAKVYYDLFMQSTSLIGIQKNEWLWESVYSYNTAIEGIYKKQRVSDAQLDRLKMNTDLVLKYVTIKESGVGDMDVDLLLEAERSNRLRAEILKLSVDNAEVYRRLATLYSRMGKVQDAIAYLERIKEQNGKLTFDDLAMLADLNKQLSQYEPASQYYKQAYHVAKTVPKLKRNALLNDWVEMSLIISEDSMLIRYLVDSSQVKDAYEYFVIANLMEGLENLEGAEKYYLSAIATDSTLLDASYNLGILYYNKASQLNKRLAAPGLSTEEQSQLLQDRQQLYVKALPLFIRARSLNPSGIDKIIAYLQKVTATG